MIKMAFLDDVIFDKDLQTDLCITARGFPTERILYLLLLDAFSNSKNLAILCNTNDEKEFVIRHLPENYQQKCFTINSSISMKTRIGIYSSGGVFFVTSRILVMDLLTGRLSADILDGIVVHNAHKAIDSFQESFILRLYREKNKTGFIRALSDRPEKFIGSGGANSTDGDLSRLNTALRKLMIGHVTLLPRFHASLSAVLDKSPVPVEEVNVQLSPPMNACQMALLDLIGACIRELKTSLPSFKSLMLQPDNDDEEDKLGVDSVLSGHAFGTLDRLTTDVRLSQKAYQLVVDLRSLRAAALALLRTDAVTFYTMVENMRQEEKSRRYSNFERSNSGWIFSEAADRLFANAKLRISAESSTTNVTSDKPSVELPPKLLVFLQIFSDICSSARPVTVQDTVIIVVIDSDVTAELIQTELALCLSKAGNPSSEEITLLFYPLKRQNFDHDLNSTFPLTENESLYSYLERIVCDNSDSSPSGVKPVKSVYIMLYTPTVLAVRQCELIVSSYPSQFKRVYFIVYEDSIEQQIYLQQLRRESMAFKRLIDQSASLFVTPESLGLTEDSPCLRRGDASLMKFIDQPLCSGSKAPTIVVDMREFRSELPSLLYKRGIDILPRTLKVSDYVLTPDIGIERKTVADLFSSLTSSIAQPVPRLFEQTGALFRSGFRRPCLLIEFDANAPFCLSRPTSGQMALLPSEAYSGSVHARLAMLITQYPRLRLLWARSPLAAADLLLTLKADRPDPLSTDEGDVVVDDDDESNMESRNWMKQQRRHRPLLEQLLISSKITPDKKNLSMLTSCASNLSELSALSEAELISKTSSRLGRNLYDFLHTEYQCPGSANDTTTEGANKPTGPKLKRAKQLSAARARMAKKQK